MAQRSRSLMTNEEQLVGAILHEGAFAHKHADCCPGVVHCRDQPPIGSLHQNHLWPHTFNACEQSDRPQPEVKAEEAHVPFCGQEEHGSVLVRQDFEEFYKLFGTAPGP